VADDTVRDALITNDKIEVGHIIYHETDGVHYFLETYPTFGSLTGVSWGDIGGGTSLTDADIKTGYENNSNTNAYNDSDKGKVDNISITQSVDLDQLESDSHTHSNKSVLDGTTESYVTSAKNKIDYISITSPKNLDEVETSSQLNTRDTNNRSRTNHNGVQAQNTIQNLETDLGDRVVKSTSSTVTDSTSVTLDCLNEDSHMFDWTSGNAATAISITNLNDLSAFQILPLQLSSAVEYTFTITSPGLSVKVNDEDTSGSGVVKITAGASGDQFEIIGQRKGTTIYILFTTNRY
jgi:hypothetical protein